MARSSQPSNYGKAWTREELILAFELYCRIPFRKTKASNPLVQDLAALLDRSNASIARKLGNFGAFDMELKRQNISGLVHASKLDREIWDEFHLNWSDLVFEAHGLRDSRTKQIGSKNSVSPPTGPSERVAVRKTRVHQAFFREAILSSFESTCCITGISLPECLIASHIIPWSVSKKSRTDPTNGLCLSATFDRLFDNGLISITSNFHVRVCDELLRSATGSNRSLVCRYHEKPIRKPHRFVPLEKYLIWHQENIFRRR